MNEKPTLIVDGLVEHPKQYSAEDFDGFPDAQKVEDVSRYHPNRRGSGIMLEAILAEIRPKKEANYLTLHADRDDFHVSIPLVAVQPEGIVVYRLGEKSLEVKDGGPFRFLIRNPAACHTDELDDCANVKYLSRMELSERKGRDTRPENEAEHTALHQNQSQD